MTHPVPRPASVPAPSQVPLEHPATDLPPPSDIRLASAIIIARPRAAVYRALLAAELADLPLLRVLMVVRTLGHSERAWAAPHFGALRETGTVYVEEVPGRAVTVARADRSWRMHAFEPTPDRAAFVAFDRPDCARLV